MSRWPGAPCSPCTISLSMICDCWTHVSNRDEDANLHNLACSGGCQHPRSFLLHLPLQTYPSTATQVATGVRTGFAADCCLLAAWLRQLRSSFAAASDEGPYSNLNASGVILAPWTRMKNSAAANPWIRTRTGQAACGWKTGHSAAEYFWVISNPF